MKKLLILLSLIASSFSTLADDCFSEYLKDASSNNFENTIKICTPLAQSGDVWSQEILGGMYYKTENYKEAFKWTKKAAEQGFAPAQSKLGLLYETGKGTLKDYKKAIKWYRKSAAQGNITAQNNMGLMYEMGYGVLQNYQVSASWYKKAADAGSATAQMNLGIFYCDGLGVEKNLSKSKALLSKAYESGDLSSGQQGFLEKMWEYCELANY
jgi:TPR repeat protein